MQQGRGPSRFWGWTLFCWLMLILLLVLGLAKCVYAVPVFRATDQHERPMWLKLLEAPCPQSVVRWLPTRVRPEFHQGMRAAILHWGGEDWEACWIEIDGDVYSIDSEGVLLNSGRGVPRRLFRDDSI